jgi:hypothetical protein
MMNWINSTSYAVGDVAIDSDLGTVWSCLVANNSAAAPTTFAQDRAAHPSYWGFGVITTGTAATISYANGTSGLTATNVQAAIDEVDARLDPVVPSNTPPLMNGPAVVGVSQTYARGDHGHPSDTSRASITYVDAQDATKAPIASPTFTGVPRAPTPALATNDTTIATTAFVAGSIGGSGMPAPGNANPIMDGPAAPGISNLYSRQDHIHPSDTSKAAVTYVDSQDALKASITYVDSQDALKAPIASPTFTGTPAAPTPTAGDSSTKVATTAFVGTTVVGRPEILSINGGMDISQENGTTPVTTTGKYTCDGWLINFTGTMTLSAAQYTSGAINGMPCSIGIAVTTAQTVMGAGDFALGAVQRMEGLRTRRLAWGIANPQPISIGFWTAHHRTGIYSVAVRNLASNRSYVATYTQAVSDVYQYNTITIPGDTTGTWNTDNTLGIEIDFAMACGTTYTAPSANNWLAGNYVAAPGQVNAVAATSDVFRITGIIMVPGTILPASGQQAIVLPTYDQELAACQRYFQWIPFSLGFYAQVAGAFTIAGMSLPVTMRGAPTIGAIGVDPTVSGSGSANVGGTTIDCITLYGVRQVLTSSIIGNSYVNGYRASANARL